MKTRIKKVHNFDQNRTTYPHRYISQVQKSFLFCKYWNDINWSYSLDSAKVSVDAFILVNTVGPRGTIEVIGYPEGQE